MIDTSRVDMLALVNHDLIMPLKKKANTNGGEWAGACPKCGTGEDRFRVWPSPADGKPSFWCRRCDQRGDAIEYLRWARGFSMKAACEVLALNYINTMPRRAAAPQRQQPEPPVRVGDLDMTRPCFDPAWQAAANQFLTRCYQALSEDNSLGAQYLALRGIEFSTAIAYGLGYNPAPIAEQWGPVEVYLPRGIVIPWEHDHTIYNVRVRRFPKDIKEGQNKYTSAKGSANGLFHLVVWPGATVVLTEGEFNAVSLEYAARRGCLRDVVATGTGANTGGRVLRWVSQLSLARRVLLAFDPDEAGQQACAWWQAALGPIARPLVLSTEHDHNDLLTMGMLPELLAQAVA